MTDNIDRMLTREEVAKIFGIKPKTTYKWVAEGSRIIQLLRGI